MAHPAAATGGWGVARTAARTRWALHVRPTAAGRGARHAHPGHVGAPPALARYASGVPPVDGAAASRLTRPAAPIPPSGPQSTDNGGFSSHANPLHVQRFQGAEAAQGPAEAARAASGGSGDMGGPRTAESESKAAVKRGPPRRRGADKGNEASTSGAEVGVEMTDMGARSPPGRVKMPGRLLSIVSPTRRQAREAFRGERTTTRRRLSGILVALAVLFLGSIGLWYDVELFGEAGVFYTWTMLASGIISGTLAAMLLFIPATTDVQLSCSRNVIVVSCAKAYSTALFLAFIGGLHLYLFSLVWGGQFFLKEEVKQMVMDDIEGTRISFQDVRSIEEVWMWLEGPMAENFFQLDEAGSEATIARARELNTTQVFAQTLDQRFYMAGGMRLRTLRMPTEKMAFTHADAIKSYMMEDYFGDELQVLPWRDHQPGSVDRVPWRGKPSSTEAAQRAKDAGLIDDVDDDIVIPFRNGTYDLLGTNQSWGGVSESAALFQPYPQFGHWWVFPASNSLDKTLAQMEALKDAKFIDETVRAVLVDFVLFNLNVGNPMWVRTLAYVEMPATGGFWPRHRMELAHFPQAFPLGFSGHNGRSHTMPGVLWGQVMHIFGTFLMLEALIITQRLGIKRYIRSHASEVLVCTGIAASCYQFLSSNRAMPKDPLALNWGSTVFLWFWHKLTTALLMGACYIKLIEYTVYIQRLAHITRTMLRGLVRLAPLMAVFILVFGGFVLVFHVIFGTEMEQFRTVVSTSFHLVQALSGGLDMSELFEIHRATTFILVLLFQVWAVWGLLTFVLSIFDAAYTEERGKLDRLRRKRRHISAIYLALQYQAERAASRSARPLMRRQRSAVRTRRPLMALLPVLGRAVRAMTYALTGSHYGRLKVLISGTHLRVMPDFEEFVDLYATLRIGGQEFSTKENPPRNGEMYFDVRLTNHPDPARRRCHDSLYVSVFDEALGGLTSLTSGDIRVGSTELKLGSLEPTVDDVGTETLSKLEVEPEYDVFLTRAADGSVEVPPHVVLSLALEVYDDNGERVEDPFAKAAPGQKRVRRGSRVLQPDGTLSEVDTMDERFQGTLLSVFDEETTATAAANWRYILASPSS